MLDLVSTSYLISITGSEQVAQIRGKAIYAVRDVTLIPLASQAEAEKTIVTAQRSLKQEKSSATGDETEESDIGEDAADGETSTVENSEQLTEAAALEPSNSAGKRSMGSVSNAGQDKGRYGRFAKHWFSKKAKDGRKEDSSAQDDQPLEQEQAGKVLPDKDRNPVAGAESAEGTGDGTQGQEIDDKKIAMEDAGADGNLDEATQTTKAKSVIESLTPRILRIAKLFFSTSGFFFSYDHDLSGTLTQRGTLTSSLPLWKRFDSLVGRSSAKEHH